MEDTVSIYLIIIIIIHLYLTINELHRDVKQYSIIQLIVLIGRDDTRADCILYTNFGDMFRQSTMVFAEQTGLEKLYAMVAYAYDTTT